MENLVVDPSIRSILHFWFTDCMTSVVHRWENPIWQLHTWQLAACSAVPTWEHHIWQLKNQQRTASKTSAVHRWEHPIWQLHNSQLTTVLFTDESIRFGSWICCSSIRILSSLYKLKFWLRTGGYREHYYLDMLIFQPLQGIFSILCCIIVLLENPTHYVYWVLWSKRFTSH